MINFLKISTITIFIFFSCENNPAFYTDCNGESNGLAIEDNCGNCDNDPTNDCTLDCNNIWVETLYLMNVVFVEEMESLIAMVNVLIQM